MRRTSLAILAGLGALGLFAGAATADTLIYDSGGFDTTSRFSSTFVSGSEPLVQGNLRGQDSAKWFYSGANTSTTTTSSATVITSATGPTNTPSQAVQVTRTSGDGVWAPVFTYNATGQTVKVTWSMNLATLASATNFGPFFGIDGYTSGNARIGGAGIDASTGELLYEDPTTGFTAGNVIGTGWKSWEIDYNFGTQKYNVSVGGVVQTPDISFLSPSASTFASADIAVLQDDADHPQATATAYFDDYKIVATPEPATAAVMLFGVLGCGIRSRRK